MRPPLALAAALLAAAVCAPAGAAPTDPVPATGTCHAVRFEAATGAVAAVECTLNAGTLGEWTVTSAAPPAQHQGGLGDKLKAGVAKAREKLDELKGHGAPQR